MDRAGVQRQCAEGAWAWWEGKGRVETHLIPDVDVHLEGIGASRAGAVVLELGRSSCVAVAAHGSDG